MSRGLALLLLLASCRGELPSSPPHVVVWLVDTLRADHLGCYGYARDTSPVMDGLAAGGVLFEDLHVHSNWTQPSLTSLLSGCHPPPFTKGFTAPVPAGLTLAAECFAQAGYATAGMTVTVASAARYGFDRGFRVYEQLDYRLDPHERKRREGARFDAERLVDEALAWLDHRRPPGTPFFLFLHSVDPHAPYESHAGSPTFTGGYEGPADGSVAAIARARREGYAYTPADRRHLVDLYDDEVRYNDAQLGRLLEGLQARGLADDTLVVVVSDHGEEFWERGDLGHGHENLHAELTHVPLILNWPAGLPAGVRVTGLARAVDLLPTLLELCGLPSPPGIDGRSLGALMQGRARADSGADAAESVFVDRAQAPRDVLALRTPDTLLQLDPAGRVSGLYDLRADPGARRDVSTDQPALRARLEAELRARKDELSGRVAIWRGAEPAEIELGEAERQALEALGYLGEDG